jgi:hypothetical protein
MLALKKKFRKQINVKKQSLSIFILLTIMIPPVNTFAQDSELYISRNIQKAYENQTRSITGLPGSNYWQNRANYKINVDFYPKSRLLKGEAEIIYFNNSPDTLKEMYINLFPNFFKKGQVRDEVVAYSDESDGVIIEKITISKAVVDTAKKNKKIVYGPTNLKIILDSFIAPKTQVPINIKWCYNVNKGSHGRTGGVDSTTYFIAYFFPHIAVYDDIDGWDDFHFKGDAEFYNDFGDFDVNITVPGNFVVWATGLLKNPDQVLQKKYLKRFQLSSKSEKIVHIVDSTEALLKDITKPNTRNAWQFKAENVSDFAFATSDHYLWDATSLVVDTTSGERVFINVAYNKDAQDFYKVTDISRRSIEYMSFVFPAVPFPFPQITVFNGLSEMEYPMMVNNWTVFNEELEEFPNKENYLIALTAHEIFHSYFPFYMGINESKYAWMDEGWATFEDYAITNKLISNPSAIRWDPDNYLIYDHAYKEIIGSELDLPMISISKMTKRPTYSVNSYAKPAMFYLLLENLLGKDVFKNTVQEYMQQWNGKHPIPYDFFFTFNEVSGQNLNWLFKPWFFDLGYPDLSIKKVTQQSGEYEIEIEKIGHYPVPINLKITYEDGSNETIQEKVSVWKSGDSTYSITSSSSKKIKKVELGDVIIPDSDLGNNVYFPK